MSLRAPVLTFTLVLVTNQCAQTGEHRWPDQSWAKRRDNNKKRSVWDGKKTCSQKADFL